MYIFFILIQREAKLDYVRLITGLVDSKTKLVAGEWSNGTGGRRRCLGSWRLSCQRFWRLIEWNIEQLNFQYPWNKHAGNLHPFPLKHHLRLIFLLDWWRLVASTFAASTYLNMILLNKEVILWLLVPLENPQILDLIKHQKTKHYLVMLCLHCLCGMCFFVFQLFERL